YRQREQPGLFGLRSGGGVSRQNYPRYLSTKRCSLALVSWLIFAGLVMMAFFSASSHSHASEPLSSESKSTMRTNVFCATAVLCERVLMTISTVTGSSEMCQQS